ncbi:MAG: tetratricopeptide repeat protein [Nitrosopumilus sp.]
MEDIPSYFDEKVAELKKAKKFEEALKFADKAKEVKQEERAEDFWYKKAVRCQEFGEYEDAIKCLDKEVSIHSPSFETYFLKGQLLVQLKDYAQAIECFNKASEERNQQYLKNIKKVNTMTKARKFEKALKYKDLTANEIHLDEKFWRYKGIAFLKLKKYENAKECFTNALEMKENDSKTLYNQAKCELFLGNEENCLDILKKSCDLDSSSKERLREDDDFSNLSNNKKFRTIVGL